MDIVDGGSGVRQLPAGRRRVVFDAAALLIYTVGVYGWSLTVWPLGRDFALLAGEVGGLGPMTAAVVRWEAGTFGESVVPYRLVNLALIYACTLLVYAFARLARRGSPAWHGTLAAAIFMAHPAHSDGVLNLLAAADLLPAMWGLGALALYAWCAGADGARSVPTTIFGVLGVGVAAGLDSVNVFLPAVCLLYEGLIARARGRVFVRNAALLLAAQVTAGAIHAELFTWPAFNPARALPPLYFLFYPLGFLPETAARFYAQPWLAWAAGLAAAGVAGWLYTKVKRPAMLFGLLGAAVLRLFQGERFVDPVHLIGGGSLLVATGLFALGLSAFFARIAEHPNWRRPVVSFTTFLCLVLFGMEIRTVFAWRQAAREVKAFQAEAASSTEMLGLLPDYRYYRGAPVALSESISYDTAFSRARPHMGLLPLHYDRPDRLAVTVASYGPEEAIVTVRHDAPWSLVPWPYRQAGVDTVLETEAVRIEAAAQDEKTIWFRIRPLAGELPETTLPRTINEGAL